MRLQLSALAFGVLFGILVAACGPSKPACGPGTCPGCCSVSTGMCETGVSLAACGKDGQSCAVCQLGLTCQFGQCQGTQTTTGGGSSGVGGGSAGGSSMTGGGSSGGTGGGSGGGTAVGGGSGGGTAVGGGSGGGTVTGGGSAGGSAAGGGTTGPMPTTITSIQQGVISLGTCVQVSGVAMSAVFPDGDDAVVDGGVRTPRPAFYLSEKNLTTTTPFSGIEVVSTLTTPPTASIGDDLVVIGEYFENFNNSTLRLTPTCGAVTRVGATTVPQPAVVTLAQVGQSGGSPGCPVTGAAWVDGANAEEYEGVLVRVQTGTVSAGRDSFGVFEVASGSDKLQVSTSFGLTANPAIGGVVSSLTGFGHFSFCRRKLRPRTDADVTITAGATCGGAARTNHLVVTEVAVTPTPGEFVEVWNPTSAAISLTNVYVYNATFQAGDGGTSCSYPLAVSGGACGTGFSDFNLRFPAGATIAPGEFQTIALTGAANYCGFFSCQSSRPTYEVAGLGQPDDPLVANMLGDFDNRATVFVAPDGGSGLGLLSNTGEELVLYSWDGFSSTVQDIDYVLWGASISYRTDKTGLPGYLPDTPVTAQRSAAGAPTASTSYQRVCTNEGTERRTGGNGLTGHDETSEDLDVTWLLQAQTPKAQTNGASP